jgi:CelD/BcsL family acetyltransferase involved in cellulose biosynthesis
MSTIELTEKPAAPDAIPSADSPATGPYRIDILRTPAEFAALRQEWNALLDRAGIRNLCMSHAWLNTWLHHFPPDQLFVVIVKDGNDRWIGAAPLMINKSRNGLAHRLLRHVQFIGTHPTVFDWMSFIYAPEADPAAVMNAIGRALQGAAWDVLDLMFCLDRAPLEQLCRVLPIRPASEAIQETTPIPYLPLPATEAEYDKVRRKKTRLEVNRHCNRFTKEFGAPLQLEFQPATEASHAILTRFFAGHVKYWSDKGQKSDFQRFPKLYDFYKDMLDYSEHQAADTEPKLLFSVLKMEDYQLSYHLGFWQGNSYLSHITHFNQGFKGYSPGTIHMDKLVFETIRRGGVEFEFGRGDEPYKKMWTQTKKPLWQLRHFKHPLAAALWQVDIALKTIMGKAVE